MSFSIAIVTGANKGIGYGIVETLAQKLSASNWKIYLTSRDIERGKASLEEFHKKGYSHVQFHQLDIDNEASIVSLRDYMKATHAGGINILVNNAGIAYKNDDPAPFVEQSEVTMKTNFYGTLNVCKLLFPLLAKDAKVVHVSSTVSCWAFGKLSEDLKKRFISCDNVPDLVALMKLFVDDVKAGNHEAKGWPSMAYGVSKLGVTKLAQIQAAELKQDARHIVVNACCPGYVDTDMTSHKGSRTISQGAATPSYLALLTGHEPNGAFVSDNKVVDWQNGESAQIATN